jgi:methyl-accepting chemotaxis protein
MSEQEAVSHHDCDLGKWLYGQGLARFGDLPEMQKLEKIHAEMHTLIKQVVRAQNSGDTRKAESAFARVERYSDEIVTLLEQLEKQTGGGSGKPAARSAGTPHLQAVGAEDVWEEF